MKYFRLIGVLLFILMMGNACKTYKSIEKVQPRSDASSISQQVQKLKPGDAIKVYEKGSGRVNDMEYVTIEDGFLRGFEANGTKDDLISIRLEDIARLEVKKFNAGKTVLLTGAVIASAYLIAGIVLLVAWGAQ
jgi:hypothetical protein